MSFMVSQKAWDALPSDYQAAFAAATEVAGATMQRRYDALNPMALKRLLEEGVTLRPFADDIMRASREAADSLLDDEAAKDGTYRKILEHWRKFRKQSFDWFGTNELAYAQFAHVKK
ncbi:unnamed protein product [Discosporangium mesarthrocarpum]